MPVTGSDLHWYLSSSGASEGGAMSATEIANAVDNNVFPDVSDSSRIAGGTMTRKVFVANEHATDAMDPQALWIVDAPTNCTSWIGLGFDDADDDDGALGTLSDFSAPARVALVSDGADTRAVDIWGLVGTTPTKETVTLTGNSEVLSVATFTSLYATHTTVDASRSIQIRQDTAGTIRGSIAPGAVNCFRWLTATTKATGVRLPALPTGSADGLWERATWAAAVGAVYGNVFSLQVEAI